ncbi:AroM family protein [Streptomyces hygroscopicus]|uniref:AroM family protein n=1 Tax=Streptomyces hygroscopicus TaxID=1912 RepID=UPI0036A7FDA9
MDGIPVGSASLADAVAPANPETAARPVHVDPPAGPADANVSASRADANVSGSLADVDALPSPADANVSASPANVDAPPIPADANAPAGPVDAGAPAGPRTPAGAPALGLVTIGQAPRADLRPDAEPLLPGVRLVEHGALDADRFDGDAEAATRRLLAPEDGEAPLISRLRDGRSVLLGHGALIPRIEDAVGRAERDGAAATLLLCTGRFPAVRSRRPLLFAEPLVQQAVAATVGTDPVGIVCPHPDQAEDVSRRWAQLLPGRVQAATADPYGPAERVLDDIAAAARTLADRGSSWLVLDCIGYTERMRAAALRAAGRPVLLARAIAVRMAAEVVAASG